jgi:hypothetical protein
VAAAGLDPTHASLSGFFPVRPANTVSWR